VPLAVAEKDALERGMRRIYPYLPWMKLTFL